MQISGKAFSLMKSRLCICVTSTSPHLPPPPPTLTLHNYTYNVFKAEVGDLWLFLMLMNYIGQCLSCIEDQHVCV